MANNIYIDDSTETTDEALQELINQYNALGDYNAKTSDQIKAQAEGEYTAYYDQLKRTAQQANETQDLALQQQKNALQATYDKQRKQTAEEYANTYSQADRQMLSRGMQRSSYGAATLANIGNKAAEAQNEIGTAQTAAENNIEQQRQQLASQLATTLSGYDADKAANVLSRMQQLEDTEYERGVENRNTRNSLAAQIYEYMANRKAQDAAQAQWQAEFDENVRQFNIQLAENQRQFDEQMAAANKTNTVYVPAQTKDDDDEDDPNKEKKKQDDPKTEYNKFLLGLIGTVNTSVLDALTATHNVDATAAASNGETAKKLGIQPQTEQQVKANILAKKYLNK